MAPLDNTLTNRIRERARDPARRTDTSPTARGKTISAGPMNLVGVRLGGRAGHDAGVEALAPPVTIASLAAAETALGFELPEELRCLYLEDADGGFGPGPGLLCLDVLTTTYQFLIANPPGRRGQTWPAHSLPITATNPGHDCVDLTSGQMIYWDEEVLADGPSDRVWKRSFKAEADSVAAWLEAWLATQSPEEQMRAMMEEATLGGVRDSLAYWRSKTAEERAAFGLPEIGWEQELFGHLGIDLRKL